MEKTSLLLAASLIAAFPLSLSLGSGAYAQFNPFDLAGDIFQQGENVSGNVIGGATRDPLGTFEELEGRVFDIEGSEEVVDGIREFAPLLRFVPGVGNERVNAASLLDAVARQTGIAPTLPRSLSTILDAIVGPESSGAGANSDNNCLSRFSETCEDGSLSAMLSQLQGEAAVEAAGPLGISDPAILRATIQEAAERGLNPDVLVGNRIVGAGFAMAESDRQAARARSDASLSIEGQERSLATIQAVDTGLGGIIETAEEGLESTVTQEVVKALLSATAQNSGFQAISTINGELEKADRALMLSQMANVSQSSDAARRRSDVEHNATSNRLLFLSRRRAAFSAYD